MNDDISTNKNIINIDDEGVPDVYEILSSKLSKDTIINQEIKEVKSIDWIITQQMMKSYLDNIQSSTRLRQGEIVLFIRNIRSNQIIVFDQLFNIETNQYTIPTWESGIISSIDDSTEEYKIEPVSSPSSTDKSYSKRFNIQNIKNLRPFCLYKDLLKSIKPKDWHNTIHNTLEIISSISLLNKYYIKGVYPSTNIYSSGLFLGSELLLQGDLCRLINGDIIQITSIKLKFIHMDNKEYDNDRRNDCCLHINGHGFTSDLSKSFNGLQSNIPDSLSKYGKFYNLNNPEKRLKIPFSRLAGRLYEYEDLNEWSNNTLDINYGIKNIINARSFSSKRDERISKNKSWYWADHRIEQLDLVELNGQLSTNLLYGHDVRDYKSLKRALNKRK